MLRSPVTSSKRTCVGTRWVGRQCAEQLPQLVHEHRLDSLGHAERERAARGEEFNRHVPPMVLVIGLQTMACAAAARTASMTNCKCATRSSAGEKKSPES